MGNIWIKFVDYWYGEYPPPTVLPQAKEYVCHGCGSRIYSYVIREYKNNIDTYFCSVKCFEKPFDKLAIK